MKQSRPLLPQGLEPKKEIMPNNEDPQTMTVGPFFRPLPLRGPDDTEDTKTLDKTQGLSGAEVDATLKKEKAETVDETQKLTGSEDDKTTNRTQELTDTDAVVRTQKLTDAPVTRTVNGTQNSTHPRLSSFGGKRGWEERRRINACPRPAEMNISEFPALKDYLPASCSSSSYDYHVCHYQSIGETGDHVNFKATLRMDLSSEEQIKQWVKSHTVSWRTDRTIKSKGERVLFGAEYRCQHNTKPGHNAGAGRNKTSKNTNCPAKMAVTLLRIRTVVSYGRPSVCSDPHVPAFPTIVSLCSEHNHDLNGSEALRYRDVGDKTQEKLLKLFAAGHNPTSALEVLKINLQVEHGENYEAALANRELCPTLGYCYRLRYKALGKMRRESSLTGSQKKRTQRKKKKKARPDVLQRGTADEEQHTDNTEELVENMITDIRDICRLRNHPVYSQAINNMAKQFRHIKSNPSTLLTLFAESPTSSTRTAAVRPATTRPGTKPIPCQPTAAPCPVPKPSSQRRPSSGRSQTQSRAVKRQRTMESHV